MIIIRYLVRETLKSQLAILFILLLIFFCQKLVRILGAAVDGDIPANLVLSLLGLGVPEMAQLILPLSLFLGLLMTLGKLYTESEITVMHACGLSKAVLVKAAMILAVFTAIVAAVNVMWAGPWSSRHQDEVLAEAKANPGMAALAQGQFQQATNGSSVLFIESVDGSDFMVADLSEIEAGALYMDGILQEILPPSTRRLYWRVEDDLTLVRMNTQQVQVQTEVMNAVLLRTM